MTDQQAEAHLWLAFVNAEARREDAPPRDLEGVWRARLLRAIRLSGRDA
jgi:hypothetical protein